MSEAYYQSLNGYYKTYTSIGSVKIEITGGASSAAIKTFMDAKYAAYIATYPTSPISLTQLAEYLFNAMLEDTTCSICLDTKSTYIKVTNNATYEYAVVEYKH